MEIEYKIYKLIDPISDDVRYIGLTFNTLKERLKSHKSERSKSHKSNWIKSLIKEGHSPKIELIEGGLDTHERACEREIYWISKFKEEGYNLTNMATGGNKNKKMSDETRLKMSLSQKEKNKTYKLVLSNESKMKISISTKLRMQDPKEIEKLRISNKRYEDSKTEEQKIQDILKQKTSKKVIQYDKKMNYINEFLSIKQAAKKSNIENANISKCCRLNISTAGGYVWRFEGDLTPLIKDKRRTKKTKIVEQYDLDMNLLNTFSSVKEASLYTKCGSGGIFGCASGKFNTSGGFIWKYK